MLARLLCVVCLCAGFSAHAAPPIKISSDWVRATAPGQDVGAAYMTLKSPVDAKLVKVESDIAKSVEIHSMSMKDGVMQMRMLDVLPLPAHKEVALEPGGFHLMLFDLKAPLKAGSKVKFKLHVQDSTGKEQIIQHISPVQAGKD